MNSAKPQPLDGIRVLDFTHNVMGPAAGMLLGDLGAEVIHIEPPGGDATRRLKGFGTGYFPFYSRNKKSLAVDLKSEAGQSIVTELVAKSDVLIENFGPGTMDRLGFGFEALKEHRPDLIYCSLKGFLPGPYERRAAMDEVVQMMGGLAYMTGPPGQPLRAGSSVIDIGGGMFGVMGILTALFQRERTGQGALVRGALFETTAFFMGQHMAYSALTEGNIPPMPARVSAWSVYRIFQASDHPVFVGIISNKHWKAFCEVFERSDWLSDPRLETNNSRIDERHWLLPEIEKVMAELTRAQVIERCERVGVPVAPIATPEELFEDDHLCQSGGLVETELRPGERADMPRIPVQMEGCDFGLRKHPPLIGEHTTELLQMLGYTDDAVESLARDGIVVTAERNG